MGGGLHREARVRISVIYQCAVCIVLTDYPRFKAGMGIPVPARAVAPYEVRAVCQDT